MNHLFCIRFTLVNMDIKSAFYFSTQKLFIITISSIVLLFAKISLNFITHHLYSYSTENLHQSEQSKNDEHGITADLLEISDFQFTDFKMILHTNFEVQLFRILPNFIYCIPFIQEIHDIFFEPPII